MRQQPWLPRVLLVAAVVAANVVALAMPAAASVPTPVSVSTSISRLPPPLPTDKHQKLDSQLVAIASAANTGGDANGLRVARNRTLVLSGDSVRVVVKAPVTRSAVRDAVQAVGGRVEAEYADLVQAFVPVSALRKLAELPVVAYVGQPSVPAADAVVDEGVAPTNASAWQGAGVSGAGVKVGIIDVGFIGYTAAQASGDLPASLTPADFGCGGVATTNVHGTAVAEIVYKMAPGAQLFLICIATLVELGQANDYAIAQGIKIVNHSVGWYNSGRGEDRKS